MKKTIKVDELKKEIEILVNIAFVCLNDNDHKMYEYCYRKAICYVTLIQGMCIDLKKPSYEKEYENIDKWFNEITNNAIYK